MIQLMETSLKTHILKKMKDEGLKRDEIVRNLAIQMLNCVEEIHKMKRIHRDINPDNFIVDNGKVYITNVGKVLKI